MLCWHFSSLKCPDSQQDINNALRYIDSGKFNFTLWRNIWNGVHNIWLYVNVVSKQFQLKIVWKIKPFWFHEMTFHFTIWHLAGYHGYDICFHDMTLDFMIWRLALLIWNCLMIWHLVSWYAVWFYDMTLKNWQ